LEADFEEKQMKIEQTRTLVRYAFLHQDLNNQPSQFYPSIGATIEESSVSFRKKQIKRIKQEKLGYILHFKPNAIQSTGFHLKNLSS